MLHKLLYRHLTLLAIATIWEITTFFSFVTGASAQTFEPPIGNPSPPTTLGGGRRGGDGQCLTNQDPQHRNFKVKESIEQQLTPLVPPNKFGLTISSHPKFFAYIPKTTAIAVEFTLENSQGKGIDRKRLKLTNTPSIVNVQFEKTPLEVGKDYKWLVSVVCKTGDPEDLFAEGLIRRIKPESTLLSELEKVTAIEKVYIYAKLGIWYEAIADLAYLHLSQPHNTKLKTSWLTLLNSSGLEPLARTPLQN